METIDYKALYEDARERAKKVKLTNTKENVAAAEYIFPDLKESEDERIRKWIIEELEITRDAMSGKNPYSDDPDIVARLKRLDEGIAYLERQKEQKPISSCDIVPYIDDKIAALQDMWREEKVAFDWDDMHEMIEDVARHFYQKEQEPVEWNDADMREARNNLISVCRDWERGEKTTLLPVVAVRARYFLEHLIEPKKPAEWSNFDKAARETILCALKGTFVTDGALKQATEWFEKLRPSWKPSRGQMSMLLAVINEPNNASSESCHLALAELYDELKKL